LAIVERASSIFEKGSFRNDRSDNVATEDVKVLMEDAAITWGFKIKQMTAEEKEEHLKSGNGAGNVEIEEVKTPQIANLNVNMKSGDFLCVVGKVGCGKTTFLQTVM